MTNSRFFLPAGRSSSGAAGCAGAARLPVRAFAAVLSVIFALALCLALAPRTFADAGDLDEITSYRIDVTPDTDGSLAIVATVDWKVLDSDSEGPLEWVQIGLPNASAENLAAETSDTISDIYRDGEYAHIVFDQSYYAGETVHFSYSWTQRYMYTLGKDGSVSYEYTPGWFDNANVDSMQVIWHYNNATPDAATAGADCAFTDANTADEYTVTSTAPLAHSDKITLTMHYASWPATLDTGMSADQYNPNDYGNSDDGDAVMVIIIVIFFSILILVVVQSILSGIYSWVGGFYDRSLPHYRRRGGLYYDCDYRGVVPHGAVGHAAPPSGARAFGSMGGGHSHGGGGGRSGGGCACASSCACACACAGGGRAGCSAKNLYGVLHIPAGALAHDSQPDENA